MAISCVFRSVFDPLLHRTVVVALKKSKAYRPLEVNLARFGVRAIHRRFLFVAERLSSQLLPKLIGCSLHPIEP
ncbi:MAG TPA: hypothetical protein VFI31_24075 [Pirellulales bacterium]|nr:hypothetical protein [Pirellulales bacterium]